MQQPSTGAPEAPSTASTGVTATRSGTTGIQEPPERGSMKSTASQDSISASAPPDNPEKYYDVAPAWEPPADDDEDDMANKPIPAPPSLPGKEGPPAPPAPPPAPPVVSTASGAAPPPAPPPPNAPAKPPAAAAGISSDSQVPTEALAQLKQTQNVVNEPNRRQSMVAADTSTLRDKFVQRGAASFVAQLRATKETPDILVSLILTKEMLLVAKKPS